MTDPRAPNWDHPAILGLQALGFAPKNVSEIAQRLDVVAHGDVELTGWLLGKYSMERGEVPNPYPRGSAEAALFADAYDRSRDYQHAAFVRKAAIRELAKRQAAAPKPIARTAPTPAKAKAKKRSIASRIAQAARRTIRS